MMGASDLFNRPLGNHLFRAFLKIGQTNDESYAMAMLNCYELCDKIIHNIEQYRDYMDDLIELCPSYLWEEKLQNAIESKILLQSVLNDLKLECVQTIKTHHDFDRFQRGLLQKFKNSTCD